MTTKTMTAPTATGPAANGPKIKTALPRSQRQARARQRPEIYFAVVYPFPIRWWPRVAAAS